MAGDFRQLTLGAKQTSYQVAGRVVAALASTGVVTDGGEAVAELHDVASEVFSRLQEAIDADNEFLEQQPKSSTASSWQSSNNGPPKFNFGAFKGFTISEVAEMDEDAAANAAKSNGKEYSRSGADYLEWLTEKDKHPSREFMRKQAQEYFDNAKAGV